MVLAAAKRTSLKPFIFAQVVPGSAIVLRAPLNAQRSLLRGWRTANLRHRRRKMALHAVIPAGSETRTPTRS